MGLASMKPKWSRDGTCFHDDPMTKADGVKQAAGHWSRALDQSPEILVHPVL